jgi:hypothetical protein
MILMTILATYIGINFSIFLSKHDWFKKSQRKY